MTWTTLTTVRSLLLRIVVSTKEQPKWYHDYVGAINEAKTMKVNIKPLPTEEERAEMREIDRKLDAIAAKRRRSGTGV